MLQTNLPKISLKAPKNLAQPPTKPLVLRELAVALAVRAAPGRHGGDEVDHVMIFGELVGVPDEVVDRTERQVQRTTPRRNQEAHEGIAEGVLVRRAANPLGVSVHPPRRVRLPPSPTHCAAPTARPTGYLTRYSWPGLALGLVGPKVGPEAPLL